MSWFKKKERLNLGVPCKWSDIKVGEVFGLSGCFHIMYKETENGRDAVLLDSDRECYLGTILDNFGRSPLTQHLVEGGNDLFKLYKLPKETQELYLPK